MSGETRTVDEWVRGWVQTYVPNEDAAEVWTERALSRVVITPEAPLTPEVRAELEETFGMPSEDSPTALDIVEEEMSEHFPAWAVDETAEGFLSILGESVSWLPLGSDPQEDKLPPGVAAPLRKAVRKNLSPERVEQLRKSWGVDP